MGTEDCFDSKLFTMTTITIASVTKDGKKYSSQGSAFYYNEQSPAEPGKTGPQWYRLDKHWLVTNRHVVLPKIDNISSGDREAKSSSPSPTTRKVPATIS